MLVADACLCHLRLSNEESAAVCTNKAILKQHFGKQEIVRSLFTKHLISSTNVKINSILIKNKNVIIN